MRGTGDETFEHLAGDLRLPGDLAGSVSGGAQGVQPGAAVSGGIVWPGREWRTASPESQGLSGSALDSAAAYALKSGGGSGCVIRHGYLVKEWGDPRRLADIKSATKGTVGRNAARIGSRQAPGRSRRYGREALSGDWGDKAG